VANVPPQGGRKHPQQKYIEVNSKDILFICGGAFEGVDRIVEKRIGKKSIGFGAEAKSRKEYGLGELYAQVEPEDLLRYGLIPELVGRLPVVATLSDLDEAALLNILTQPKNAIIKQYQKFFEMEDAQLAFTEPALRAIAHQAMQRNTGARALRSAVENLMLDVLFELPNRPKGFRYTVTAEVVRGEADLLAQGVPIKESA